MDGTLVAHHEPIWKTLHRRLGSDSERRKRVIEAALSGTISYADWFAADLEMLREAGANREAIEAIVDELHPTPGAIELVRDLRTAGCFVALVSGGLDLVRQRVLKDAQFDAVHINRIHFGPGGEITGGRPTSYDRQHKVQGIEALAAQLNVALASVAFVGDGSNDVHAARVVGCSIAWGAEADPGLVAAAEHHVVADHMSALRPILLPT